jgi:hypothetical protein
MQISLKDFWSLYLIFLRLKKKKDTENLFELIYLEEYCEFKFNQKKKNIFFFFFIKSHEN